MNQDVARFAVKCGMWGVVKNMDVGFRKFQKERVGSAPPGGAISGTSSGPGGVDGATGRTVVTPGGSADGNGTNLGGGLAGSEEDRVRDVRGGGGCARGGVGCEEQVLKRAEKSPGLGEDADGLFRTFTRTRARGDGSRGGTSISNETTLWKRVG